MERGRAIVTQRYQTAKPASDPRPTKPASYTLSCCIRKPNYLATATTEYGIGKGTNGHDRHTPIEKLHRKDSNQVVNDQSLPTHNDNVFHSRKKSKYLLHFMSHSLFTSAINNEIAQSTKENTTQSSRWSTKFSIEVPCKVRYASSLAQEGKLMAKQRVAVTPSASLKILANNHY